MGGDSNYTQRNKRIRNLYEWERRSLESMALVRDQFLELIEESDNRALEINRLQSIIDGSRREDENGD